MEGTAIVTGRPPASRNVLKWQLFDEQEPEKWVVHLMPTFYSEVFGEQLPKLMLKSNTGWRDSKSGKTKYTFFKDLSDLEVKEIQAFINDYRQFVVLGLNQNINFKFSVELDSCLALDYIADSPKALYDNQRTPVGKMRHEYKYEKNRKILPDLSRQMIRGLRRLPGLDLQQEHILSFVPPKPNKHHDLPRALAYDLADRLADDESLDISATVLQPTLLIDKPQFKDLNYEQKVERWQAIYDSGGVHLSDPVKNRSIIVIDDLYQSGTTIWSYARFLKLKGASTVHGLVCIKTFRDTDNR